MESIFFIAFTFSLVFMIAILANLFESRSNFKRIKPTPDITFSQLLQAEQTFFSVGIPSIIAIITGFLVSLSGSYVFRGFTRGEASYVSIGGVFLIVAILTLALAVRPLTKRQSHYEELTKYPERILLAAHEVSTTSHDALSMVERLKLKLEDWRANSAALTMGWNTKKSFNSWQAELDNIVKELSADDEFLGDSKVASLSRSQTKIDVFNEEAHSRKIIRNLVKKHKLRRKAFKYHPMRFNWHYFIAAPFILLIFSGFSLERSYGIAAAIFGVFTLVIVHVERGSRLMLVTRRHSLDTALADFAEVTLNDLESNIRSAAEEKLAERSAIRREDEVREQVRSINMVHVHIISAAAINSIITLTALVKFKRINQR